MRIHDGSPLPILQDRGVFVPYDEFKKRRLLRGRVKAAFEKFQGEGPLDVERPAGTPAQAPGAENETP